MCWFIEIKRTAVRETYKCFGISLFPMHNTSHIHVTTGTET